MTSIDTMNGLLDLIRRLRSPEGCPWDRVQTDRDLGRYLLSEAYEVIDAIDEASPEHVREELGDLLFQILFLVVLAEERGEFEAADVVREVADKMVRRHPHVFGDKKVADAAEVKRNWDEIKATVENKKKAAPALFDGVPRSLPALAQAQEITKRAARVGFDWDAADSVLEKIEEELNELRQALKEGEAGAIREELGDLFFSLVNLSRFIAVDAEQALRGTIAKFIRRFAAVERGLQAQGKDLTQGTLAEMNRLWEATKRDE